MTVDYNMHPVGQPISTLAQRLTELEKKLPVLEKEIAILHEDIRQLIRIVGVDLSGRKES